MIRFAAVLILVTTTVALIDIASESKFWTRMVDAAKKRARELKW